MFDQSMGAAGMCRMGRGSRMSRSMDGAFECPGSRKVYKRQARKRSRQAARRACMMALPR